MNRVYLIDSHILIWSALGDPRLSPKHAKILTSASVLFVSVASIWEIEIKLKAGRLNLPSNFADVLADGHFDVLAISASHALNAARLPLHHRDPFDRMLVAQAQSEGLTILSADARIKAYQADVV